MSSECWYYYYYAGIIICLQIASFLILIIIFATNTGWKDQRELHMHTHLSPNQR